jgi:hypothetical protein
LRKATTEIHTDEANGYEYYLFSGAKMTPIRKFRSVFYNALAGDCMDLDTFIRLNKLDLSSPADIIRIVDFYNKSKTGANVIAKHGK